MKAFLHSKHNSFYTVGISYKKADAGVRGQFSMDEETVVNLLRQAKSSGIEGLMVISTCNRTELFGFAQHPFQLIQLLCGNSNGTVEQFQSIGYVYKNYEAIHHMFKVGAGLDSQILGDFEIIGQLKQSFIRSKKEELTNPFLERLCNSVIQASKRIKTETEISSGATSVAFASVQYILSRVPEVSKKNILLFGTGKIGRNTCENLVKHTRNNHIVLINRTREKAERIAGKFNLIVKEYAQLQEEIRDTDVLIVATGATHPTVNRELIHTTKPLLILDLSIPKNVDDDVKSMDNVTLVHLDQLSKMTDDTLKRREKFIPKAKEIIEEVEEDFKSWLETRKFAPTIKALKKKLKTLKDSEIEFQRKKLSDFNNEHAEILTNRIIQKITTQFANHLKECPDSSDESIELIKKVFQLETTK
ncbi:glutamyl-tRNA reductase [Robertkochia solimangrovi]|uniref:glutamyl-tRNA reductase n=1 Tax=Robertkochia solimangrovi TaxID=2213046 RepID=UPI001180FDBA|nr:glutamyl-tRNA reductase [Robertkochia solimangrovi]TRZ45951.1 glutamyl-tRNA reductase [Robertkochia solimangrovi]